MSESQNALTRLLEMQERLKTIEKLVGQAFSDFGTLRDGKIDIWKTCRLPPRAMLSLIHFQYRGEQDHVEYYSNFVDKVLRGSVGFNGAGRKEMENMVASLGGNKGQKLVTRKSWTQRNITQRGQPEYQEVTSDE